MMMLEALSLRSTCSLKWLVSFFLSLSLSLCFFDSLSSCRLDLHWWPRWPLLKIIPVSLLGVSSDLVNPTFLVLYARDSPRKDLVVSVKSPTLFQGNVIQAGSQAAQNHLLHIVFLSISLKLTTNRTCFHYLFWLRWALSTLAKLISWY